MTEKIEPREHYAEHTLAQMGQHTMLTPRPCDADALEEAGQIIRGGGLVAFPTETVYGLGADATNGQAVASIYEAKGRPRFNPLIVHVQDLNAAEVLGQFSAQARALATACWPGPLTIVVPRRDSISISDLVCAGLSTLALRVPDHPVARGLLKAARRPLAAPSANRSGHVSATTALHVARDFGNRRIAMILDGGPTAHGLESTIVGAQLDEIMLLRPGAIPAETLEALLGRPLTRQQEVNTAPSSPGQLASHYAPRAGLRLDAHSCAPDEGLLAFGPVSFTGARLTINLSPNGSLIEAAANLFAALRQLDAADIQTIAVMPIPQQGLGEAINDRLKRAAAPRD